MSVPDRRLARRALRVYCLVVSAWILLTTGSVQAQSPAEHASHHPGSSPAAGAMPGGAGAPAAGMPAGGGMMEQMGEMMKGMGAPPPKQLYPALMSLPELTPEKRLEIEQQAADRIREGTLLMGQALDALTAGARSGNNEAMHDATMLLREGVAQFESGTAARRALSEGRAPREVALTWFKREMLTTYPGTGADPRSGLGLSVLHLLTMALLIAFALAMLAMYFFKMRRAQVLFGRLEVDAKSPPPGSSPPLGGTSGPSAPPGGKPPPSGGSQPPKATPEANSTASPPADKAPKPPADGKGEAPGGTPAAPASSPATSSGLASTASPPAPLTAKWHGELRVERILVEAPAVKTFRLGRPSDNGPLPFTFIPGQFLNVAFCIGGARMNRSYSISSSPNEHEFVDLTVKREERGAVSRHINDLVKVGDMIEAGGPVGTFTFTGTEADSIVLIGAGVGITPMMSVVRFLTERSWPGDIFFIFSCRAPSDLTFEKEIAALERRNLKLHVTVTMSKPGPDWRGPRGRITGELLTQAVPDLASRRVHVCGPAAMMDATKAILMELGVSPDNVKTEAFGAVKPAPGTPGTSAKPTTPATGPLVTFSSNGKSAKIRSDQTILELSEELGIGIQNSCRVGTCGVCKVKMTSGEVEMAVEDSLDADDKAGGLILACQAKPKTEVAVEA